MRTDLGDLGDLEALQRIVEEVAGLSLIEAGCAAGDTARRLAELGARVLAVEPDELQAEKNRAAPAASGVTFVEAGAQALPAEDASMELMDAALGEAARVLKPDGFLYVAEPGMEGSHFTMMRPFNDEFEVRTLAQQALERSARPHFEETTRYVYMQRPRHESFAAMVTKFSSLSYNPIARELIEQDEVRKNFEAGKSGDGYVFEQPMLINFHRRLRCRN